MIGVMSSPSQKATPGQPQSMDEDDAGIKSPSSGTVKMTTITSFFKPKMPKMPKPTPENPLDKLRHVNADDPPASSRKEIFRDDSDQREESTSKLIGQGQSSEVTRKDWKCGDSNIGYLGSGKDGAKRANSFDASLKHDTLKSGNTTNDDNAYGYKSVSVKSLKAAKKDGSGPCSSKLGSRAGRLVKCKSGIYSSRRAGCPDDKSSKKRKNAELDSSSDDFEVDKRTKMSKNEQLEINGDHEFAVDEVPESQVLISDTCNDSLVLSGSDEDIFEDEEVPGNPKVISYLDFLNESMEKNRDEISEIICLSENGTGDKAKLVQTDDTGTCDVEEVQQMSENQSQSAAVIVPQEEKTNLKKTAQSEKKKITKNAKKSNKLSTMKKQICRPTKKKSVEAPCKMDLDPKEKSEHQHSVSHLPEDDSVLTISFSDFLEDKSGSDKPRELLASLQLSKHKQKLVTIEAQVHSPPNDQPRQPAGDRHSPVNNDLKTIDLCHLPKNQKTPVSKKRTSNVVVNMSNLDLMIISTDDASSAAETKKSKMVYSIFQKKGNMEKSKETESKTKPEHLETSKMEQEVPRVKAKVGRPRKRPIDAALSPGKTLKSPSGKTNKSLKNAKPKTRNGRQVRKALKTVFGAKSEEENTEEEFEEEENKKSREVASRRRGKPMKLGSRSGEGREDASGRGLRKSSKQEIVVMTSTPKAKNNKNAKAQQLLRKAKSLQLNRASPLPFQVKDAKRVVQGTKAATQVDNNRGKSTTRRHKSESRNQTGNQRDLTNVLGRRVTPQQAADDGKGKAKTRNGAAKGKAAVEVDERKPTKLAPMFTKEGRLAIAKKQKSSEGRTSDSCPMVILDDDEASRDSVQSDVGVAFSRRKECEETEQSYPPFPAISHILQMAPEIEGNVDWWKLPFPSSWGKFPIKDGENKSFFRENFTMADRLVRLGEFTLCSKVKDDTVVFKRFNGHPELSHGTQRLILDRIKAANPRFPVNRVFKRYLAKRKGESSLPKLGQGGPAYESKCNPKTDSNFTKLKVEKSLSAKRKAEVLEQRANSKRRRVARDGSAENSEAEFIGKIRLRRRSSRWVIRDDEDEEKQEDAAERPKPRRSSRQSEQATKREIGPKDSKEGRSLRVRRGKNAIKEETGKDEKKEGSAGIADAKGKETLADKLASLPWTEKYQPVTSTEIIGNPQAMKRLTGWLTEWKKKTSRIKKKMKRQRGRQQNKTQLALPVEDSDSDFDVGSDSDGDTEDDDDSLSNAMMIVGPSGCGKTAAVYACAKELGFKVFEVNASSKRTGKQILADLGEATQSHHLLAHHHGDNNSTLKSFFTAKSPTNPGAKPAAKMATPIPKAFAAFYKAGADAAAAKQSGKKPKAPTHKSPKKVKPTKPTPGAPSPTPLQQAAVIPSGGKDGVSVQRLTSTSLILFEDVDIVFDEDKGFLSAIATFLKTTKRPIILTTSDGRFPEIFEERCELVTFCKPPSLQLATHLQLLCLAENVYASHSNLHHVVSLLGRDVRRCWLAAQFWVGSGAGRIAHNALDERTLELQTLKDLKTDVSKPDKSQGVEKRLEVPCGGSLETDIGDGCGEDGRRRVQLTSQSGCLESIMGLCNLSGVGREVSSMLKIRAKDSSCLHTRSTIAETFQKEDNTSVYFRNIHSLLPPPSSVGRSNYANQGSTFDQSRMESPTNTTNGRTAQLLNHKLMTSLAVFADGISSLDSHTFFPRHDGKGPSNSGWWGAVVKPALALDCVDSDNYSFANEETGSSIRGFLEAASFDRCHRNYEKTIEQLNQLDQSERSLGCQGEMQTETPLTSRKSAEGPVQTEQDGRSCFKLQQDDCTKCPQLYPTLISKLPLLTRCNHRVQAMDYLPTLRCVCRSEQIREELKIKRRFLHYLDSISLNLKKTDQIALCSIMEVKQRTRRDDKPREKPDGEYES